MRSQTLGIQVVMTNVDGIAAFLETARSAVQVEFIVEAGYWLREGATSLWWHSEGIVEWMRPSGIWLGGWLSWI